MLVAAALLGACEPIRPNENPSPPASARESQDLTPAAEAQVQVSGVVASDAVLGTHELTLTVVNGSRWSLTDLRVRVRFESERDSRWKEYVLRSRGTVGPGQSETLSTLVDGDSAYGRPPAWRYVGALGYPPGS